MHFFFHTLPSRVWFGPGRIEKLRAEIDLLVASKVMICCTKGAVKRLAPLANALDGKDVVIFGDAAPHCPEEVVVKAQSKALQHGVEAVVAFGGGSTLGLGKYLSARNEIPFVAVPTTYSGSEMTAIYGMKTGEEKRTWKDVKAVPRAVIYDPELTLGLPADLTGTTGMNSLAHAVEALYPAEPNPLTGDIAEKAIGALARGLVGSVDTRDDLQARTEALYGGFLGGLLVTMAGIALHHRICHVLGGLFGAPHGESNSVILPYVVAYNAPEAPEAMVRIRRALGVEDAAAGVYDLARTLGVPASLDELGVPADGLAKAAAETVRTLGFNPRACTVPEMTALFEMAHAGTRPTEGCL